jgi:hypothetical protein
MKMSYLTDYMERKNILKTYTIKHIFLIYFAIIIILFQNIYSHPCGIQYLKTPKRILFKSEGEDTRHLKSEDWQPLRIHLDYSSIQNNIGTFSKEDYNDLKDKIMPKTKEILEKLLKVKRSRRLKLPNEMCDHLEVPETYTTEGVDADIVIFVLIDDTGMFMKNKIEAAAIHCFQDTDSRRPIAGYIQFKPDLKINNSVAVDYMVWLAIHEITHILVMNDSLYDDWLDDKMVPYGFNNVVGKKILPNGKAMSYIKTPKILEKGKKHYNCDSFKGLPLEYNGGVGTVGGHWAKKYMNTDYMIGDSYGENLISELSLAMFEDSGWYQVDYSLSNLFLWGKNKGCDFFNHNTKCVEMSEGSPVTKFKNEFCTQMNNSVCSISNIFRANCKTKFYDRLSIYEKYFGTMEAGVDTLTDKCPIAIEVKNGQTYYGGSCRFGNKSSLSSIENVCPECACFVSSLREKAASLRKIQKFMRFKQIGMSGRLEGIEAERNSSGENEKKSDYNSTNENDLSRKNKFEKTPFIIEERQADYSASCYEFKCEGKDLYVIIGGKSFKCDKEQISIDGYDGNINCPSSEILCHEKFKCKFGCIEKY